MQSIRKIGFLFFGVILSCLSARADDPTATQPSSDPTDHIQLRGYEKVNDAYVFQLYFTDLPANKQPGLKKMGDPSGWKGYIVGPFSVNMFTTTVGDGPPQKVDASTLELIDPKTGHKIVLTYHGQAQNTQ
jgi:hypothetical protein